MCVCFVLSGARGREGGGGYRSEARLVERSVWCERCGRVRGTEASSTPSF
jgi:hypothetical protein